MKDILVFMSDQHTPYYSGFYGGNKVDTPNLNKLAEQGVQFNECYTSSPLCGPARCSFLTGRRPAETGIFHKSCISDTTPTFLHSLVEKGYETVLVGRMHFIGADQWHGFTRHIAKDITPVTWNHGYAGADLRRERGIYAESDCFSSRGAASIAGGGTSPVLEFDRFVIDEALKYMKQPHDKPQLLFVSVYGPHFPYVAPKELYEKYRSIVKLPESFFDEPHVLNRHIMSDVGEEMALACQAAYCGMVERMDSLFGEIREAFEAFTKSRGTESMILYFSDHGDQCGDRRIFGKETFYEKSAKIPFLMAGEGIPESIRVNEPVSIMDIGPTILEYTDSAPLMDADGVSLMKSFSTGHAPEHSVYSEYMERTDGGFLFGPYSDEQTFSHGFMLRDGKYKFVTYDGYEADDLLFDLETDPEERTNLTTINPDVLQEMKKKAENLLMHKAAEKNFRFQARVNDLMAVWERSFEGVDGSYRWDGASPESGKDPEICVKRERV